MCGGASTTVRACTGARACVKRMPNLAFARHRRPRSVKQRFCCLCSVPLKRSIGNSPKGKGTMTSGIASELAAAGFDDAVEVGRGGGGVVYRCHQRSLGRSVAIKVLASDLNDDDRERFLREGYAMGALSGHPNIVNILQVGVTESGRPFIVMPYHARGSLAERLRREGRIAWPEALRIGVKLCGALETAHRTDTLHRDIKPANALVNGYGEPQLSDFGTARIAGGYKTMTGFFTGTLSYTAPEVLAGNPPTVAADVYSLAASIYALIAGGPPHERKAEEDLIAHYLRITSTPVPDLRPDGIPADVCAAIEKAMSKEPDDRQQSAEEFGRELQVAQRRNGLTADPMALSEPGGEPGGEPEQTGGTPRAEPLQRPLQRRQPVRQPSRPLFRTRVCSRPPRRSVRRAAVATLHTSARRTRRPGPPRTPPPLPRPPGGRDAEEGPQADPDRRRRRCGSADLGGRRYLHRHVVEGQDRWRSRRAESTDRRTAGCMGAHRRRSRRPRRGGSHRGRRHHLDFRRPGGGQPCQHRPRGLRPRDRQLEGRRGPARWGAACHVGDVAGHPGRARRLAHGRHQFEGGDGPGVEGCQQSLDGVAASDAASGGSRSRRGG